MDIHRVIGFEIFLCSFVNLGRVTKSITENFLGSILEAAAESFRSQDMHHDFASKVVMKGVPLNSVREPWGHANLNTS